MRLVIDMDEVIVDLMGPVLKQFNRTYGTKLIKEDITSWDLPKEMCEIFMQPDFFLGLEPFPEAIEGVRKLVDRGHDVIIATAPSGSPDIAKDKMLWVNAWMPEMIDNLYITQRKDRIKGDLICDDRPTYLMEFDGISVAMDRPWNREVDADARVTSIPGLVDCVDMIHVLNSKNLSAATKRRLILDAYGLRANKRQTS